MSTKYKCPVCNYDGLHEPPINSFEICPQCGTEFGYDDCITTHEQLRQKWIAGGSKWWSECQPDPRK